MLLMTPVQKLEDLLATEKKLREVYEELVRMDVGDGEPFESLLVKRQVMKISTLTNDATPSVGEYSVWLTGGTTTITDFADGVEGQLITIIAEHSVTITDGTNIFLKRSVTAATLNFNMVDSDILTLFCKSDLKWYEKGRSHN